MRFGSSGKPGCIAAVSPGSSRNTTSGAIGAVSCAAATSVRARARTADPATAKARRRGHAEVEQRDAERHRTGELQLDRRASPGHRAEERAQPDERLAVDAGGGERRAGVEASGRRGPASRRAAPARRRCPTRPGRPSAPCPTGSAATARPGGGAGARARRWPRRVDPCAAGCRSSWPPRAEGRATFIVARAPKPPRPPGLVIPRMATDDARGQISACHARPHRSLARPRHVGAAAPAHGAGARATPSASTASRSRAPARCSRGGRGSAVLVAVLLPRTVSLTALRIAAPAALGRGELGRPRGRPGRRPTRSPSPAPRSRSWRRSRRSPARCSSTARPTATRCACRCACRPRSSSGRCRSPGSRPWRRPIAGPLLLAAEQWVAGVRGARRRAAARGGGRCGPSTGSPGAGSCSCRPGLVLHDQHALVEAVLFPRRSIRRLGPAPGGRRRRAPRPHAGRARAGARARARRSRSIVSPRRRRQDGAGRVRRPAPLHPDPPGRAPRRGGERRHPRRAESPRRCRARVAAWQLRPRVWCRVEGWRRSSNLCGAGGTAAQGAAPAPRVLVVGSLVVIGVVVVAADRVSQPKPEPLGPAAGAWTLVPHTGLGAWVDVYDWTVELGGPAPSVDADDVDAMADAGVQTLYIQTAHTRSATPGRDGAGAPRLRSSSAPTTGGCTSWRGTCRPSRTSTPTCSALTESAALDVGGLAVDIESTAVADVAERNRRLLDLSERLRAAVGPDKAVAAITPSAVHLQVVNPSYWPAFPWSELADTYDALLPMSYWTIRTGDAPETARPTPPTTSIGSGRASATADIPIVPVGGLAEDSTIDDLEGMVAAIDERGSPGGGLYDWATSTPEQWAALAPLRDLPAAGARAGYRRLSARCRRRRRRRPRRARRSGRAPPVGPARANTTVAPSTRHGRGRRRGRSPARQRPGSGGPSTHVRSVERRPGRRAGRPPSRP